MEFHILGPLEVSDGGRIVPLGGTKQRALLAMLLLHANKVVSVDRLIDALWGESPPGDATSALQAHVSQLRKGLMGGSREGTTSPIATQSPGYVVRLGQDDLDLWRFERLVAEGRERMRDGSFGEAADRLARALALWRGPALADVAYENFARAEIERLEELRLAAWEDRIEADLASGRHRELIGELEAAVARFPVRERLRGHLMLALYRSGRQAEALQRFQEARRVLVEELGVDPGPRLRELEKAILDQDPTLDLPSERRAGETPATLRESPRPDRSMLVVSRVDQALDALLTLASPLARADPPREVILIRLLVENDRSGSEDLSSAAAAVQRRRAQLEAQGVAARAVAFTSSDPGEDILRLAGDHHAGVVLVDGDRSLATGEALDNGPLSLALEGVPCDLAILVGDVPPQALRRGPVVVPFGGADHDWAALQFGAWVARTFSTGLRVLGSSWVEGRGRDASRLLANASLTLQRVAGVPAEPVLADPGVDSVLAASSDGSLLVVGLSERWREEGLGPIRSALMQRASVPTVLVRRTPGEDDPGAPPDLTRFPWSRV